MFKVRDRVISVRFNADTAASMQWNFKPQQAEIKVIQPLQYYDQSALD
jgi:cytochrome c oxidase assembly protein subunit 11